MLNPRIQNPGKPETGASTVETTPSSTIPTPNRTRQPGPAGVPSADPFVVVPLPHPQGCRGYLVADPASGEALALDVHLDLVSAAAERARDEGWTVRHVVDSHTHADHPSGSAALAEAVGAERVTHPAAGHAGVARTVADGEQLPLGALAVTVRHAPGHTPDHVVLLAGDHLFSGDTLLIGGVARTDFLGGDAGTLYDSLQRVLADLADEVVVHPGHDYAGRDASTVGAERRENPWLALDRAAFVAALTANPPPRPANMDALLRLNREGSPVPARTAAAEALHHVREGGAASIVDVRTPAEFGARHVAGSRLVPLDQLAGRIDEVRATPAPRLLLCRSGTRAETARRLLEGLGVGGLTVVDGGIEAFAAAGGEVVEGRAVISLERQVRIGAGALTFVGVLLGVLVHPAFLAVPAFVGAGLVFAGVTDRCGMALLLARAPWNRAAVEAQPSAGGTCAASAPAACAAGTPPAPGSETG